LRGKSWRLVEEKNDCGEANFPYGCGLTDAGPLGRVFYRGGWLSLVKRRIKFLLIFAGGVFPTFARNEREDDLS
jgi:hypothetical protein